MKGYRGFVSRQAYEAHYSDVRNYADELAAMKAYCAENEEERRRMDPVDKLWDDAAFLRRVKELAALRQMTMHDLFLMARTSGDYLQRSKVTRHTNVVMRIARVLDCHPAYLMFGPCSVDEPQ